MFHFVADHFILLETRRKIAEGVHMAARQAAAVAGQSHSGKRLIAGPIRVVGPAPPIDLAAVPGLRYVHFIQTRFFLFRRSFMRPSDAAFSRSARLAPAACSVGIDVVPVQAISETGP